MSVRLALIGLLATYAGCASLPSSSEETPAPSSTVGREATPEEELTLIRADSEIFAAVVRAQLDAKDDEYPYHLDRYRFVPAGSVITGAFKSQDGGWTASNVTTLLHHQYRHAYWVSIKVSGLTAIVGGILGFLIAYAMIREHTPRLFRSVITTFSGVAANFGGIPLAFAWIATIGPLGILTVFLRDHTGYDISTPGGSSLGFIPTHFPLFSTTGVEFVYLYFQIPLAILVIAPAIDGLKREWREAASNLGASSWQFWRHVGIPVLAPSMFGMFILLFGNAFAAYATAYALTTGVVPLVPILIGYYYAGNVLDNPHLAQAMAFGMFVVLAVMMLLYIPLQRRAARWAK